MYRIVPDAAVSEQVAALPDVALDAFADVLTVVRLTPWSGAPLHEDNPGGAVRYWTFGPSGGGQLIYLVLENQREVHLLLVQWLS